MNSGAEAVETAIKAVRKWGYEVRGVPQDKAEIIVCADNFHGRTIAIVGFSTDPTNRDGFGPSRPASASSRSATSMRSPRRSGQTRSGSWSSRSRARPA